MAVLAAGGLRTGAGAWPRLLGPHIAQAVDDPRAAATGLLPAEQAGTTRMVEARRRSHAAGRRAAHAALAQLGAAQCAIPSARSGAPHWPQGFTGSISHSATLAIALAAPCGLAAALGVDTEPDIVFPADLLPEICTTAETRRLQTLPTLARGRAARALFCAKEAAFKAQFTLSGALLTFQEIEVTQTARRFTAALHIAAGPLPAGFSMNGELHRAQGQIVAAVCVPPRCIAI